MTSPTQSHAQSLASLIHDGTSTDNLQQQARHSGSIAAARSRPTSSSSPPVRTPSLATLAREIAQDIQFSRSGGSPTPFHSSNKFQIDTVELGNPDRIEDLQLGRDEDELTTTSADLMLNPVYRVYNTYDKYTNTYDTYNASTYAGSVDHHDHGFSKALCPSFPAGVVRFMLQDEEETKVGIKRLVLK